MQTSTSGSFPVADARAIVGDLLKPNPLIYWLDFLVSLSIAYGCAAVYFLSPLFSPQGLVAFVISGFALHRVGNYMHEVVHLSSKRWLRHFQIGWNILAGVPMLTPSFFFENHLAHHRTTHYGTRQDCEYVPLGTRPLYAIPLFMCQLFLQPIFVVFRFVIVTPISFLHPKLRRWVLRNFSSFVFMFPCPREIPKNAPLKWWAAMDILCWLRATAIFATVILGTNPWFRPLQLYALAVFSLSLHYFRSMTAHNYMSEGERMDFRHQMHDSIDIKGNFLTELLYPIGLRYHALHHLFPTMPFHNLGRAHRRLMAQLPADSPYRELVYPSVWSVLKELIQHSRASRKSVATQPSTVGEPTA